MWSSGACRAAVASVPAMPSVSAQQYSGQLDSVVLPGDLLISDPSAEARTWQRAYTTSKTPFFELL